MHCQLCDRSVETLTIHHLIPRQTTKRKKADPGPTIQICSACHRQIHQLFSNAQLALELNSADALKNHPDMRRFLTWVSKQKPDKYVRVNRRMP